MAMCIVQNSINFNFTIVFKLSWYSHLSHFVPVVATITYTLVFILGLDDLRETVERLKNQVAESARQESMLVMRLADKEQEVQDLLVSDDLFVFSYYYW